MSQPDPFETVAPPTLATGSLTGPPDLRPADARIFLPGYEVLEELGRGGMGVVYKARHLVLGRLIALKMILRAAHSSDEERLRFRREAEAVARLQHPNIIQIYEVGDHEGQPYFSLELCEAGSLDRLLRESPLPSPEAARLTETLARAMEYAHRLGIIHRDLKPANILLQRGAGTGDRGPHEKQTEEAPPRPGHLLSQVPSVLSPKITDFGLAKRLDDESGQTRTGAVMGTPSYMAPEQALGRSRHVGPAADIYALGAILYECLTGRPPFLSDSAMATLSQVIHDDPASPRRLRSNVPRDLETICLKCLDKNPDRRYPTASALADDLARFQAGEVIRARPASVLDRAGKWARRRPAVASLLGLLALVLVFGYVLLAGAWRAAEERRGEAERDKVRAQTERTEARRQEALAKSAVEAMEKLVGVYFSQVSEASALQTPELEPLRRALLQMTLAFYRTYVDYKQNDPDAVAELAVGIARMSRIAQEMGTPEESRKLYEQILPRLRELEAKGLGGFKVRREEGNVLHSLAMVRRQLGETDLAKKTYLEAIAFRRRLANANPAEDSLQADLAASLNNLGALYHALRDTNKAFAVWDEARKIREPLAARQPRAVRFQADLSDTYNNLGVLWSEIPRPAEARVYWEKALAVREQMVRDYPDDDHARSLLFSSLLNLGALAERARDFPRAGQLWTRAEKYARDLVEHQPARVNYLTDLASVHFNLAWFHLVMGEPERARDAYTRSREIEERLARRRPNVLSHSVNAALCEGRLADIDLTARPNAALDGYARAIRRLEDLGKKPGGESEALPALVTLLVQRARALSRLGQHDESLRDWDRALKLSRDTPSLRAGQAVALARKGDWRAATQVIDQVLQEPRVTWEILFDAAQSCALARAALLADPKVSAREKESLASKLASQARESLIPLDRSGYFKLPLYRQELERETALCEIGRGK